MYLKGVSGAWNFAFKSITDPKRTARVTARQQGSKDCGAMTTRVRRLTRIGLLRPRPTMANKNEMAEGSI